MEFQLSQSDRLETVVRRISPGPVSEVSDRETRTGPPSVRTGSIVLTGFLFDPSGRTVCGCRELQYTLQQRPWLQPRDPVRTFADQSISCTKSVFITHNGGGNILWCGRILHLEDAFCTINNIHYETSGKSRLRNQSASKPSVDRIFTVRAA